MLQRLFVVHMLFNIVFSVLRNLRTIIGLIILAIIGGFIYYLVINDFNVALAFTQISNQVMSVYHWVKQKVVTFWGYVPFV